MKNTYPNHIRAFMERAKLAGTIVTQTQLSSALRMTQPNVSDLINGKIKLTPERAVIIAALLHCQPWELSDDLSALNSGGFRKNSVEPPFDKQKLLDTWKRTRAVIRRTGADFDEETFEAILEQAIDYMHLPDDAFDEKLETITKTVLAIAARQGKNQSAKPGLPIKKKGNV